MIFHQAEARDQQQVDAERAVDLRHVGRVGAARKLPLLLEPQQVANVGGADDRDTVDLGALSLLLRVGPAHQTGPALFGLVCVPTGPDAPGFPNEVMGGHRWGHEGLHRHPIATGLEAEGSLGVDE